MDDVVFLSISFGVGLATVVRRLSTVRINGLDWDVALAIFIVDVADIVVALAVVDNAADNDDDDDNEADGRRNVVVLWS